MAQISPIKQEAAISFIIGGLDIDEKGCPGSPPQIGKISGATKHSKRHARVNPPPTAKLGGVVTPEHRGTGRAALLPCSNMLSGTCGPLLAFRPSLLEAPPLPWSLGLPVPFSRRAGVSAVTAQCSKLCATCGVPFGRADRKPSLGLPCPKPATCAKLFFRLNMRWPPTFTGCTVKSPSAPSTRVVRHASGASLSFITRIGFDITFSTPRPVSTGSDVWSARCTPMVPGPKGLARKVISAHRSIESRVPLMPHRPSAVPPSKDVRVLKLSSMRNCSVWPRVPALPRLPGQPRLSPGPALQAHLQMPRLRRHLLHFSDLFRSQVPLRAQATVAGPGVLSLSSPALRTCWCLPCAGGRLNPLEFGRSHWNGTDASGFSASFLLTSPGLLPPGGLPPFSAGKPPHRPSMRGRPPLPLPLSSGNFSCVDLSPSAGSYLASGLSTRSGSASPWRLPGMPFFSACAPELFSSPRSRSLDLARCWPCRGVCRLFSLSCVPPGLSTRVSFACWLPFATLEPVPLGRPFGGSPCSRRVFPVPFWLPGVASWLGLGLAGSSVLLPPRRFSRFAPLAC